jgi:hypothetical protein
MPETMTRSSNNRKKKMASKREAISLLLVLAVLALGIAACGEARQRANLASKGAPGATGNSESAEKTPPAAKPTQTEPRRDGDGDRDNSSQSYYDSDDNDIIKFGRLASQADSRTVAAMVRRYYTVASASDGTKACGIIYSLLSESIAEEYGQLPGPPSLRGKSCAVVMSKLFKQHHRQLVADLATFKVLGVRTNGKRGYALLGLHSRPERYINIHREFGSWKIYALLDSGLP